MEFQTSGKQIQTASILIPERFRERMKTFACCSMLPAVSSSRQANGRARPAACQTAVITWIWQREVDWIHFCQQQNGARPESKLCVRFLSSSRDIPKDLSLVTAAPTRE
jgi:hypothetical protein